MSQQEMWPQVHAEFIDARHARLQLTHVTRHAIAQQHLSAPTCNSSLQYDHSMTRDLQGAEASVKFHIFENHGHSQLYLLNHISTQLKTPSKLLAFGLRYAASLNAHPTTNTASFSHRFKKNLPRPVACLCNPSRRLHIPPAQSLSQMQTRMNRHQTTPRL